MDNPETSAIDGTQDEDNTENQTMCNTRIQTGGNPGVGER